MLGPDFFKKLGLFVERGFLDEELCHRLRSEVTQAPGRPATVWETGETLVIDKSTRSTTYGAVSAETRALVESRLLELRPRLEQHFGVALDGWQPPGFLVYGPGDFYIPHRDSSPDRPTRGRRVSVVVFVNGESETPGQDGYRGGALTFYGLLGDSRLASRGLPVRGEPGLLVAFPSELVHGVSTVEAGVRCTIVTWFLGTALPASADAHARADSDIALASEVRIRDHVVSREIGADVVLMSLTAGGHFGLNAVAADVWRMIQRPTTLATVVEGLLARYDVDAAECAGEVRRLIGQLRERNLIDVIDGADGPPTSAPRHIAETDHGGSECELGVRP